MGGVIDRVRMARLTRQLEPKPAILQAPRGRAPATTVDVYGTASGREVRVMRNGNIVWNCDVPSTRAGTSLVAAIRKHLAEYGEWI